MANAQLSPPGSSVYSSDTMYVGDGTWDSSRNTFLLPNLQGLNLATTQYNGMGNRFRDMAGYHSIIKGHGIVAAITFLGIVPTAIFVARFYHRSGHLALRLHIWLQILTVALATVIFVLGWLAVGPKRALTNPHHGIGLAIYVAILVQATGGWWVHKREKGRERYRAPLKLVLHQWLGRAIAILGFIQVALGLTLYGSPKVLFILYALWGSILFCVYFAFNFINRPMIGFDEEGTYISERTDRSGRSRRSRRSHRGPGLGALAAAGAAGAGLSALRRRSRSRRRHSEGGQDVISSRHSSHHSESFVDDEKYTEDGHGQNTWRERLFGAATAAGAIAGVRALFNRNKRRDDESEVSYGQHIGGTTTITQTDLSRIEEGRAPESPANDRWRRAQEAAAVGSPLRQSHRPRRSGESIGSSDSRTSFSGDAARPENHGLKDGIAALGLAGFIKHKFNSRRNRKEEQRVVGLHEQELEDERIARRNSQRRRFTGDGSAPPRRSGRRGSSTIDDSTDISGTNPALSRHTIIPPPPPMNLGSRTNVTTAETTTSNVPMPPAPLDPQGILHDSGSEAYASAGGGQHHRHQLGRDAALAAGAGAAAGAAAANRDTSRQRSSNGSVASPPVSVKVKMHNDGRHVTLRRLNEEEAAAEREARRRERQRRHRNGSLSSVSNVGDDRFRRTETAEAGPARPAPIPMPEPTIPGPLPGPPPGPPPPPSHASLPQNELHLPPPPPIPAAAASAMSTPPGTNPYETGTDVSNYDNNRRRRRAERAQAKIAKGGGRSVEFS
ncbi:uncharacterized protein K441DRAFT_535606 [Cenococcum geophilum 1.58]|uniref:uncharacterized protein n=1 Tax=Cenococcum geophilum 1.58 TaxID=794803 RepID=UPI0035902F72|nr:hypothetical protein K441DRAFT_535606 [Cenococcum geophilum 1.58]